MGNLVSTLVGSEVLNRGAENANLVLGHAKKSVAVPTKNSSDTLVAVTVVYHERAVDSVLGDAADHALVIFFGPDRVPLLAGEPVPVPEVVAHPVPRVLPVTLLATC
jgi:hypothetical protein